MGLSPPVGRLVPSGPQDRPQHDRGDSQTARPRARPGSETEDHLAGVSHPALGIDCGGGFLHGGSMDPTRVAAFRRSVLPRVVDPPSRSRWHRLDREWSVDGPKGHRCRRRHPAGQTLLNSRSRSTVYDRVSESAHECGSEVRQATAAVSESQCLRGTIRAHHKRILPGPSDLVWRKFITNRDPKLRVPLSHRTPPPGLGNQLLRPEPGHLGNAGMVQQRQRLGRMLNCYYRAAA